MYIYIKYMLHNEIFLTNKTIKDKNNHNLYRTTNNKRTAPHTQSIHHTRIFINIYIYMHAYYKLTIVCITNNVSV